jgi:hypothetical protein
MQYGFLKEDGPACFCHRACAGLCRAVTNPEVVLSVIGLDTHFPLPSRAGSGLAVSPVEQVT